MEVSDRYIGRAIAGVVMNDYSKDIVGSILRYRPKCYNRAVAAQEILSECVSRVSFDENLDNVYKDIYVRDYWRICYLELEVKALCEHVSKNFILPIGEVALAAYYDGWKNNSAYEEFVENTYLHRGTLMLTSDYMESENLLSFKSEFRPAYEDDEEIVRFEPIGKHDLEDVTYEVSILSMRIKSYGD